jgi:hypothetical protein
MTLEKFLKKIYKSFPEYHSLFFRLETYMIMSSVLSEDTAGILCEKYYKENIISEKFIVWAQLANEAYDLMIKNNEHKYSSDYYYGFWLGLESIAAYPEICAFIKIHLKKEIIEDLEKIIQDRD